MAKRPAVDRFREAAAGTDVDIDVTRDPRPLSPEDLVRVTAGDVVDVTE